MLHNTVTQFLQKYFGKYVANLSDEHLRIGILNGEVELTNLELRREALFQLDLPIEIKAGCIGRVLIKIPWSNLSGQPVVIQVDELFVVAGPISDREYDYEIEKQLLRASKEWKLQRLSGHNQISEDSEDFTPRLLEKLCVAAMNNVQIYISSLHICYEDEVTNDNGFFVCGIILHNISAETTNHKWRVADIDSNASSVFKLIKVESFSIYWNQLYDQKCLAKNHIEDDTWKTIMKKGLETFSINGEDFDFIIKPVSAKVKIILNKSSEVKVPRLLLDFVLQDFAAQLSRQQYLGMLGLSDSLKRLTINRRFYQYRPGTSVAGHATDWWHYAFLAWVEEFFRPHSWSRIQKHRKRYRKYREMYKHFLQKPEVNSVGHDLKEMEDMLDITSILVAREDARVQISKKKPALIQKCQRPHSWWKIWTSKDKSTEYLWKIGTAKNAGIWGQMDSDEKEVLFDAIGYSNDESSMEKPKQYIEHKLNLTFANCTVSLLNSNREVLVLTLTQFMTSIETRPTAQAFRLSARTESFLIEGTSQDYELVPVVTADNISGGTTLPYVFALDLEKNPLNKNADYGVSSQSEPIEVVYQEHTLSEIAAFFHYPGWDTKNFLQKSRNKLQKAGKAAYSILNYAIDNHKKFDFALNMKSPYLIIPEHGTIQKGGNVLVIDFGQLTIKSELQEETSYLEEPTRTELEERLYDRFHVTFSDIQVLFADSGDEWRSRRMVTESDSHLVPKLRIQITMSNSVKPEYKQLPRQKINVTLPSVKVNLSDGRVRQLFEFFQNVPVPATTGRLQEDHIQEKRFLSGKLDFHDIMMEPSLNQLRRTCAYLQSKKEKEDNDPSSTRMSQTTSRQNSDLHSSQDHSDDENEEWAQTIDLPGFDDNISPHNAITTLLRFVIGEAVLLLARSSDHVDKPYLMLRLEKICTDLAIMEYGPALQASLGTIQLVDKLHMGMGGEYLELITCNGGSKDTIVILYRKVRSDCPEFRSHFHNVEQSVVVTLACLQTVLHRGAFLTLYKFLQYIMERIGRKKCGSKLCSFIRKNPAQFFPNNASDPPVPPGATKCSISFRLDEVKVRLSDSDMDLTEVKMAGLETDFVQKANEKMTVRANMRHITVEDLSDMTLYTKILSTVDDRLFELKYVKHSNRPTHLQKNCELVDASNGVKCDASIRLRIGRLQICFLNKFNSDLQRFFEPFCTFAYPEVIGNCMKHIELMLQEHITAVTRCGTRVTISVDIHAPVIFVPQKSDSPNLLVFRMGDLSLENFFKEVRVTNGSARMSVTDNVLVRLSSLQMNRAVIMLDGCMEEMESLVEPLRLRLDIKRAVPPFHRDFLIYDIRGNVDVVKINMTQRDLGLLLAIFKENLVEGQFLDNKPGARATYSPIDTPSPVSYSEDTVGKRLQAFFNTSVDVCKETNFIFTFEGAQLTLFSDSDKVLSSATRQRLCGISCLKMDEVSLNLEVFSDRSLEIKYALQSLALEDIRQDSNLAIKTIFQSYSGDSKVDMGLISVSMPPMIDITYKRTQTGDVAVDILIEKTRLNVSVPYVLSLVTFLYGAWPLEKSVDGGIVNQGFAGEMGKGMNDNDSNKRHRNASSSESTSGYYSMASTTMPEDTSGIIITMKLKKPEMVLFADAADKNSSVLVLKADVYFDYNQNAGQNHLSLNIAGLQLLSCVYGKRKQTAYMVLKPCDIEFTKTITWKEDHNCTVRLSFSDIDLRLSASTVHTIRDVTEEFTSSIKNNQETEYNTTDPLNNELQDLWAIKKVLPQEILMHNYAETSTAAPVCLPNKSDENFLLSVSSIQVVCELEEECVRVPVLLLKLAFNANTKDWSHQLCIKGELQVELSYYNEKLATWESIIEPVLQEEDCYRPWEIIIKIFHQCSRPIICNTDDDILLVMDAVCGPYTSIGAKVISDNSSSDDDSESDRQMTVIRKPMTPKLKRIHAQKSYDTNSFVGFPADSDSENEDGVLEKITTAFGHMLSSSESSDDEQSSESEKGDDHLLEKSQDDDDDGDIDDDDETETGNEAETEVGSVASPCREKPIFLTKRGMESGEGLDIGVDIGSSSLATYILIESVDKLNITSTPAAVQVIHEIIMAFSAETKSPVGKINTRSVEQMKLKNKIGPPSKVTVLEKSEDDEECDIEIATDENNELPPISPSSTELLIDITPTDSDGDVEGDEVDRFSISSALTQAISTCVSDTNVAFEEEDVANFYHEVTKQRIVITVDGFDELQCFMPKRSSTRLFALHPQRNDTRYHIVVNVSVQYGLKSVLVSSPLQVVNSLPDAVHLYYDKEVLEVLGAPPPSHPRNPFEQKLWLRTIQPQEVYHVPMFAAYHCKLFVQPADLPYEIGDTGIWWQELSLDQSKHCHVLCPPKDPNDGLTGFAITATCNDGVKVKSAAMSSHLLPNFVLNLFAPLQIHNHLPFAVELSLERTQQELRLEPGEHVPMHNINLKLTHKTKLEAPNYLGLPWTSNMDLHEDMDEHRTVRMKGEFEGTRSDSENKQLALSVQVERTHNLNVYLYSPYIVINKTGLPLQLRGSGSGVVYETSLSEDPLLFRFKRHRRKKAKMRVYNSHWSASFSLDTVGCSGLIVCMDKERNKKQQFLMKINLSEFHLTKLVFIMPYFLVVNNTQCYLRFMEQNDKADFWVDISPGQSISYWPDTDSMKMHVKFRDSNAVSQPFLISRQHDTVLRMDNGSALCVTAKGGLKSPMTITFYPFVHGTAPVRVENCCEDLFLKIHQKSMGQVALLSPYDYVVYTWDDPIKERTLMWNIYNRSKPGFPAFIWKDGWGQERLSFHTLRPTSNKNRKPSHHALMQSSSDEDDSDVDNGNCNQGTLPKKTRKDKVVVYWVSYLEGRQRVLIFTQDERVAKQARKAITGSRSNYECCLSLSNVSLSLVNGDYKEVAYVSLCNMPACWYVEVHGRWKLLPLELSSWLEDRWKLEQYKTEIKEYIHVDFNKMQMTKPFFGHLQRVYFPAIWCQYRTSKYLSFIHFKAHHLQIDNQLPDAFFPTVLCPAPRPPFIVRKTGIRPFVEVALVQRHSAPNSIKTIKYFKVLIQEATIRLDKGFLMSIYDMFDSLPFTKPLKSFDMNSKQHVVGSTAVKLQELKPRNSLMFEYVHLSPLKINFSFSPRGNVHTSSTIVPRSKDILDFFLSTVGATVNEVKEVQLRVAYFHQKGTVSTLDTIVEDVWNHYYYQLMQQFYVLVLGLDVLGNPYSLVKDFTQGLGDLYYEPFFGVIQNAEEYAESVANGMHCLLGHVVGSASSGSSTMIAEFIGQCFPSFLFEEDHNTKHRQRHQKIGLPETLASATRTFPYGVSMGISGVTVKPVIGIQQEGIEGFFKVIGKRLFSLLTKPASGTVDIVDIAYDGIRRATEMGEGVTMRMRLPRYINSAEGVRPYSHFMSAGHRLLQKLSKGHYANSDVYWAHAVLKKEDRSTVILVTDRHVFELSQPRPWAEWDIMWKVNLDEVMSVPIVHGKKMVLKVRQDLGFNLFPGDEHYVSCEDTHILDWIQRKIEKVLITLMEDRPCPVCST